MNESLAETAGRLFTKPLKFSGDKLAVNFVTADGGSLRAEVQDAHGKTLEGFALADCVELKGDAIAATVDWKGNGSLADLAGKPVRLVFELTNADLYSFRFTK